MNLNFNRSNTTKLVVFCIVFILSASIFYLLFSYGRMTVSVPEGNSTSIRVINQLNGNEAATSSGKSLNRILRSGKYQIIVFNEKNQSSSYFVTVGKFLVNKKIDVSFSNQNNREKLARDTKRCTYLVSGSLYSSSCGSSDELLIHSPSNKKTFSRKEFISFDYLIDVKAYKDGLLAVRASDENEDSSGLPEIVFIQNNKITKKTSLPDGFSSINDDYIIKTDKSSDAFIVSRNKNSEIAYYSSIEEKPKIVKPQVNTSVDKKFLVTSVDVRKGDILYVIGKEITSPDSEEETQAVNKKQDSILVVIDSATGTEKNKFTFKFTFNNAGFCGDNFVCIANEDRLYVNILDGNKFKNLLAINGVGEYVYMPKKGVFYIQDKKVFLLDVNTQSSRLAFQSKNFEVSKIDYSQAGLLINATNNNILHTFLLKDVANISNFIDDVLPYPVGYKNIVLDSDFSNDGLLIRVGLESWQSEATGSTDFFFDKNEFNTKKNFLLNQVKNDLPNRDITVNIIP